MVTIKLPLYLYSYGRVFNNLSYKISRHSTESKWTSVLPGLLVKKKNYLLWQVMIVPGILHTEKKELQCRYHTKIIYC